MRNHYRVRTDRGATFHMATDAAAAVAMAAMYLGYRPQILDVAVEVPGEIWQVVA